MAADLKTDGKLYELEEMVRANCGDCVGCHDCCVGMGESIVLDPYDVWMLKNNLGKTMEQLLGQRLLSLGMEKGFVLPHVQMAQDSDACPFLNGLGRCSIHGFRPGMCRLFPLGRNYSDGKLSYILLTEECKKKNRSKMKVSQWIDIFPAEKYHTFVLQWHEFRVRIGERMRDMQEEQIKKVLMCVLKELYFLDETESENIFELLVKKMDELEKSLESIDK